MADRLRGLKRILARVRESLETVATTRENESRRIELPPLEDGLAPDELVRRYREAIRATQGGVR